jgi:hypothetical protein
MPGTRLIVSPRNIDKVWEVIRDGPDGFKYDHLVLSWYPLLSSISFDRFRLSGTPWVIQFPDGNFGPGAPALLGVPVPETPNKVWTMTKREPFSRDLSHF